MQKARAQGPTKALDRYVAAWVLAAVVSVVALEVWVGVPEARFRTLAILTVAIAVADRIELAFRFERATASFTLIEAAIAASILLAPASHALFAALAGSLLASLSRRLDLRRTLFNVSQVGVATAAAAALVAALPSVGPTIDGRSAPITVVGMILYSTVSTGAIVGVFARLGEAHSLDVIRAQAAVTFGTALGTTAVGIVGAALWVTTPELLPLLAAPAAAVHLAARGVLRSTELLERVRADRDRLTRVVDGASDGILLLDRTGEVQVWNPAMERLTGILEAEATGRPVADVLTDELREARRQVRGRWLIDEAHEGGARREVSARLHSRDGGVRSVRESHALVFDERGRCTGDVVVVRDVSRQEELERLRSDFVARVSHELRTPLTPIRGFASVLLRRGDSLSRDQRDEALERIVERADHLGEIVEDLLLVTRVDRGELAGLVHARPTDLREVLEQTTARVAEREPGRTISLHVAPGTGAALADADRVRQVIEALLDNACRYSPDDSPVEVELDQIGDDVRVRVIDHGPGIPRDQQAAVFERFHRLEDPLTMRTGGVGLGLFLARRLAEAMHGDLRLEAPRPAGGAVFVLHLPAAEPVEPVVSDVS